MYAVSCRDNFFGITKENRNVAINGIVNNTVFRLEKNIPNLGTQILSLWRRQVANDWKEKYGVDVAGFETFVIESSRRKGSVYKADNWQFVGKTQGSAKYHSNGINNKSERVEVERKLVFCKKNGDIQLPTEYTPTWNTNGIAGQITLDEWLKSEMS